MMRDDDLRTGQQTAAAASPAGPEGGEKSTAVRKGWTFKQRMNALAVFGIVMALFRLFNWLTTPAPRAPDLSGIYLPQSSPLQPQGGLFLPQGGPSPPPTKPPGTNEPLKWDNIPFSSQAPNPPIPSPPIKSKRTD
jgi:hypothetical protein